MLLLKGGKLDYCLPNLGCGDIVRNRRVVLKREKKLKKWITHCCQGPELVGNDCWPMSRRVACLEPSQFDNKAKCYTYAIYDTPSLSDILQELVKHLHAAQKVLKARTLYEPSCLKYEIKLLFLTHMTFRFWSTKQLLLLFNA